MSEQTTPCVDCVRLKLEGRRETKYCPSDDRYRCREHRAAHLAKLGVGRPVPQPPASVGRQESFL